MIRIVSSQEAYAYDAYHIVKMFFQDTEVKQEIDKTQEALMKIQLESGSCFCMAEEGQDKKQTNSQEICWFQEKDLQTSKQRKQELNRQIYRWLRKETKKELPWGILTGIRPTKIACTALKAGKSEAEVKEYLRDFYYVSEEKIELCLQVAKKEQMVLEETLCENSYSLYVGIPFCPTTCNYCSFTSYPIQEWKRYTKDYLQALCKEITFVAKKMVKKKLKTIYVGGGTPTTLEAEELEFLLGHIERTFSKEYLKQHLKEYTVEAGRADSITKAKLQVLKKYQVSRISINPQSMKQSTLDAIGRHHTVDEVVGTFYLAREMGFDNINMDLIVGLADETTTDVEDTLHQIESLHPDSVTIHALALKRASRMNIENVQSIKRMQSKENVQSVQRKENAQNVESVQSIENAHNRNMAKELEAMICVGAKWATKMKMEPYYLYRQKNIAGSFENVGYAKVDKAGIYNILIMEEIQSIIAVGAGATTKVVLPHKVTQGGRSTNIVRIENVKDVREYITRIGEMIDRKEDWIWR